MSQSNSISVVILTKNEEKNLDRCLKSLEFCDEKIVVDDFSDDATKEIAATHGAKVFERKLNGDFAAQRNYGMKHAQGDWILFIDADEEMTQELKKEITTVLKYEGSKVKKNIDAYHIRRRDYWWGREIKHGELQKARRTGFIRLVKKNSGRWMHLIHEEFEVSGNIGQLHGFINHYPHPSVADFIREVNFYSTLRAKELLAQGKQATLIQTTLYPLGKFILTYFIYLGFLDGAAGFAYSFFMSFHSFLVRAKLYQYTHFKETYEERGES